MSFLYGAFLAGSVAIALPILFHFIRRTPKGRYEFSSLMFLKPSPPKLTRRSRIDQWLLLLLRSLAIILLAVAFMRPYLRAQADLSLDDAPRRHVAILIDRSVSMQRGDLWMQAVVEAKSVLDKLDETDDVSLFAFDETLDPIVGPDNSEQLERAQRREVVRAKLDELEPTSSATNLGKALLSVAERLEAANDLQQAHASLQIVLIGDLQAGSRLDALQSSQWPETVRVEVRTVQLADPSNARVRLIETPGEDSIEENIPRVRVKNAPDSTVEQFEVVWLADQEERSRPVSFYVPPGQSLVLSVPYELTGTRPDRLELRGDGASAQFDNVYYVVPAIQEQLKIAYFGQDPADKPQSLRFYLDRALGETPARKIELERVATDAPVDFAFGEPPRLVVVAEAITDDRQSAVDRYLNQGGHALVVLTDDAMVTALGEWLGHAELSAAENTSKKNDYDMLGEIDFRHPLFVPFAGARYNDFTRVRFWKHRRVNLDETENPRVIARFGDRTPALWSLERGKGNLYVLASGWHPDDSQLALSTKFVPLLTRLLELAAGPQLESASYVVNQPVTLPIEEGVRTVRKPDGTELELAKGVSVFEETDEPGIYALIADGTETLFAVNLPDAESETAPLGSEQLEQFGVALGTGPSQAEELDRLRQLRETELESRQKIWKWLVVAVLGILGFETYLAGYRTRQPLQETGELA